MAVETVEYGGVVLAVIVRKNSVHDQLQFVTPPDFPIQVGIQNRQRGVIAKAHEHPPFKKLENVPAQEMFYLESGKVKVGIYKSARKVKEVTLAAGDIIVLNCGHKVEFVEDTRLIEVKQGPYRGKEYEKVFLE